MEKILKNTVLSGIRSMNSSNLYNSRIKDSFHIRRMIFLFNRITDIMSHTTFRVEVIFLDSRETECKSNKTVNAHYRAKNGFLKENKKENNKKQKAERKIIGKIMSVNISVNKKNNGNYNCKH